jgi:hypothetical protein
MTSRAPCYSTFDVLPAFTRPIWVDNKVTNEADPFKWSGTAEPPAIGASVTWHVNGGPCQGKVLRYFVEYGWMGCIVQLKTQPEWRKKQNNGTNPPAHLFGLDIEARQPISIKR